MSAKNFDSKPRPIIQQLNLHKTPRFVGLNHSLVLNKQEYINALNVALSLSQPIFVSTYHFTAFLPVSYSNSADSNVMEPYKVIIDKIVQDYDVKDDQNKDNKSADGIYSSSSSISSDMHDNIVAMDDKIVAKLEEVQKHLLKDIDRIVNDLNLLPYIVFSGGKGFHLYIKLKPQEFQLFPDINYQTTTDYLYSAQTFLDKNKYADYSIMGMVNGVIRMPNFPYITKYGYKTDRYAIPLTLKEVDTLSIDEIIDLSKKPRLDLKLPPPPPSQYITITEMQEYYGYELKTSRVRVSKMHIKGNMPVFESDTAMKQMLDVLLQHYPCVANAVKPSNPSHNARFNLVIHLATIFGITENSSKEERDLVIQIIDDIIKDLGWVDYNPYITHQQVSSIVYKVGRYKPPGCRKLQLYGYCLGDKCPLYHIS